MRFVEATSRVDLRELRRVIDAPRTDERIALALLHQDIVAMPWFCRDRRIKALAQKGDAGEIISAALAHIGCLTARGGSSSSAKRRSPILDEMVRDALESTGGITAFTPDGSSGPAGVVRVGVAYFAIRAQATVYCIKMSASRAFHLPTWDRTLIPLPFGELRVLVSSAMAPPTPNAAVTEVERYRRRIEDELHRLHADAYGMVGSEPVPALTRLDALQSERGRIAAAG
jgi:lysophospholipid acyltransferase (LPLAT)-like uncharacterized protein